MFLKVESNHITVASNLYFTTRRVDGLKMAEFMKADHFNVKYVDRNYE